MSDEDPLNDKKEEIKIEIKEDFEDIFHSKFEINENYENTI